jgi:cobalamin biosynthesis Mg chelatase CobN
MCRHCHRKTTPLMTSRVVADNDDDDDLPEAYKAFVNETESATDAAAADDDDVKLELDDNVDVSAARDAFQRVRLESAVASGADFDGSAQKQLEALEKAAQQQKKKLAGAAAEEGPQSAGWFVHLLFLVAAVYFGWRFFSGGAYGALSHLPRGGGGGGGGGAAAPSELLEVGLAAGAGDREL